MAVDVELNSATTNEEGSAARATNEGGYAFPIFTERPFIRPLSRRGQLNTMIRYVQMNPQRLATKRLKPEYFRVQKDIEICGRKYEGVGNTMLLLAAHFEPVHVRSVMEKAAEQGNLVMPFLMRVLLVVLILSLWPFDEKKRHISRSECVALNAMAEEVCEYLNGS